MRMQERVHCTVLYMYSYTPQPNSVSTRETRKRWPLLTVQNRAKWRLKEYKWKGSFLDWFVGLVWRYKRFLSCLGCSSRPCTKYFSPHHTLFLFICPYRQACWAGSPAGSPVSEYVSVVSSVHKTCQPIKQEIQIRHNLYFPTILSGWENRKEGAEDWSRNFSPRIQPAKGYTG
jgi:hypothetical protein